MSYIEKVIFNITLVIFGVIFYTLGATVNPKFFVLGMTVNTIQVLFIVFNN
jgi:hypothetical protein